MMKREEILITTICSFYIILMLRSITLDYIIMCNIIYCSKHLENYLRIGSQLLSFDHYILYTCECYLETHTFTKLK